MLALIQYKAKPKEQNSNNEKSLQRHIFEHKDYHKEESILKRNKARPKSTGKDYWIDAQQWIVAAIQGPWSRYKQTFQDRSRSRKPGPPSPMTLTKAIANWQSWVALIDLPFHSSIDALRSPKCFNPKETIKNSVDWLVMQQCVKAQYLLMVQSEVLLWKEGPTRTLNNEISELQARVAFPQHWSSGEHENHLERLRQLNQLKLQKSKQQL